MRFISIKRSIMGIIGLLIITTVLATGTGVQNFKYDKKTAQYYKPEQIKKCRLTEPVIINGMYWIGWVSFYPNGKIQMGKLNRDAVIQGITIPAGSQIWLTPEGKLDHCWLSKNLMINKIPVKGGPFKVDTKFYDNGQLHFVFLAKSTLIQGIPCQADILKPVEFYPNGSLKLATIFQTIRLDEKTFKKGTTILFDDKGKVAEIKN